MQIIIYLASGCLSLLVQLVHSSGESNVVRQRAAQALRNMVLCHSDDKRGRREARVLRLLDQIIAYTDLLQDDPQSHTGRGYLFIFTSLIFFVQINYHLLTISCVSYMICFLDYRRSSSWTCNSSVNEIILWWRTPSCYVSTWCTLCRR